MLKFSSPSPLHALGAPLEHLVAGQAGLLPLVHGVEGGHEVGLVEHGPGPVDLGVGVGLAQQVGGHLLALQVDLHQAGLVRGQQGHLGDLLDVLLHLLL